MNIELAYLAVEVADVDGVAAVLGGVAGMIPGAPVNGVATWRNDDQAQRILLAEGPADDATAIGFELPSAAAAAEVAESLSALGFPVEAGSSADCAAPQVEVGFGAREVGPDWDENRAYDSISMWGHQPVTRCV